MRFKILLYVIQSLAIGVSLSRAIEVQKQGTTKSLTRENAGRFQLSLSVAGQLKGNDLPFYLREDIVHVSFLISVQNRHRRLLQGVLFLIPILRGIISYPLPEFLLLSRLAGKANLMP